MKGHVEVNAYIERGVILHTQVGSLRAVRYSKCIKMDREGRTDEWEACMLAAHGVGGGGEGFVAVEDDGQQRQGAESVLLSPRL